ncbi:MAG: acyl-CoA dehydrogenase family protein [Deltaproteobacteria bacterium]|nr:acyl-CoA dehydrogenase family protein [Deltaproteobacteria bacterium]
MTAAAPRIPERDPLLEAVDKMRPVIEAGASESESLRRLPDATVRALADSGLFRMLLPREMEGLEADPVTQSEVIERVAYLDGSTAWCAFIGASSSGFVAAQLPDAGIREVVAGSGGVWPVFAGSPSTGGSATRVPGGYRVSGRWAWASGIGHATWLQAGFVVMEDGAPARDANGAPMMRTAIFPVADVEVEDSWHTMGLRGTGSAHFNSAGLVVPEERTYPFLDTTPQRGGVLFQLPVLGFFGPAFSGFFQGLGRRALDEVARIAQTKTRVLAGSRLAERAVFQRDLALADGRLRAARLLLHHELEALWQRLHEGRPASALENNRLLFAFTHNAQTAVEAAEMAFRYGGGEAIFLESPLQRIKRDVEAGAQHVLVSEQNFELLGKAMLGVDGASPGIAPVTPPPSAPR